MAHTEFYDLLGVRPDATTEEIRKAYKKMAIKLHPDKNPNDPKSAETFQAMQAAYNVLLDPDHREVYDQYGEDGLKRGGGADGPSPSFDDLFSHLFSFGPTGGRPRGKRRGEDSIIPYEVTLEEAYLGKTARFNLERNTICTKCTGSGAKSHAKPAKCLRCDGKGTTSVLTQLPGGRRGAARVLCPECEGQGTRLKESDKCKKCRGSKTIKAKKMVELNVEPGMANGHRIVFPGEGDAAPGAETGDVVFILKISKHETISRAPALRPDASLSSSNLHATVSITLSESLLGFNRIVLRHLDGRGIRISSTKPVRHGDKFVVRNEGMPVYDEIRKRRVDGKKGHLFVTINVEMPTADWLSKVDLKALEQLLPPKKPELDPAPEIVSESRWEAVVLDDEEDEADDIYDEEGEDGSDWEDEDGYDGHGPTMEDIYGDDMYFSAGPERGSGDPECRTQ